MRWHDLLIEVCRNRGLHQNSDLAYLLCKKQGKTSQKSTEAAIRSVSNWKTGSHLPSRTNLRNLTEILDIAADAELRDHWFDLYARESLSKSAGSAGTKNRSTSYPIKLDRQKPRIWLVVIGLTACLSLVVASFLWLFLPAGIRITDRERMELNNIPWRKQTSLHVGEEVVVHGKRGNCGELPKPSEKIQSELPSHLDTGILKTGKLGMRTSRRCDGPTPAREIIFKGLYPGKETFFLYGDDITVIVVE